ncbi:uncharacterized protein BDCG_17964 [Blastomyces dermatitidis ER-3]|uniref:AAA+ ATPase domain-containing protein n=1 Tax=Ajellomyces dermatitidis (strain ER-3 / ATCC MYA-2586) TaxID=559297 RepID=A0ABX2W1B9_AJEDR|nr:uncharacterized protein BDCG_17964 [Blastomyces dermatitidis ER-3]OAT03176.1 hypothetical protein BDCG_17964 [Blastomyces dermatitidis ER-3]
MHAKTSHVSQPAPLPDLCSPQCVLNPNHFSDFMDTNAVIDLVHEVQGQLWVDKVNETHRTGRLCRWVSTFHPHNLPCQLDGTFHHGAFNAGMKMVFSDGTAWMIRFPRVGMVSDNYADEKVAMEVTALSLIRNKTTIPVPRVQAWGVAAGNPLGLGPFIMMDFINGVSLSDLLNNPNAERPTRLMREDINDSDIEIIYRQLVNYLLQLFKLDFDRIGSLPWPGVDAQSATLARPLTFKAHSILQNGGVNTFGDRRQGYTTTTEYFQYVVGQDWAQLVQQPNSTVGLYDAKNKYMAFQVLKALIPDLVNAKYDRCKFKLICDDLGLANLIVRSKKDLTVIGVVDLEWSYVGPAQLFGSAPWWLLQDRPVNSAWDCEDDKPPKIAARYFKCLKSFIRILEEEEEKIPGHEERELSSLVKWSQTSGAMWLHMLLSSGFNDYCSFPFTQLRRHFHTEWLKREEEFNNTEELEAFAVRKVSELEEYDQALEKREKDKALVDSGMMTKEEFVANTLTSESDSPAWSSSFVVNNEARNDKGLFQKVAATWLWSVFFWLEERPQAHVSPHCTFAKRSLQQLSTLKRKFLSCVQRIHRRGMSIISKFYELGCTYIDCDGRSLGKAGTHIMIEKFQACGPSICCQHFHSNTTPIKQGVTEQHFSCTKGSQCRSRSTDIGIDAAFFYEFNPNYYRPRVEISSSMRSDTNGNIWFDLGELEEEQHMKEKEKFRRTDSLNMTDDDYLICCPSVPGFSFAENDFYEFAVDDICDVKWSPGLLGNLTIPDKKKRTLMALARTRLEVVPSLPFDDFVAGKGRGLNVLLYGPPGVGKTLTAEAMSEYFEQPLHLIPAAQLVANPTKVEDNLTRIFQIAKRFDALLLLDEGDVFLGRRASINACKDATVTIFLCKLEYFQGIFFLTTNRETEFDEAVLSRIHLKIRYKKLSQPQQRDIWRHFIS